MLSLAGDKITFEGPDISLQPATAQGRGKAQCTVLDQGQGQPKWELAPDALQLHWLENGGAAHHGAVRAQLRFAGYRRKQRTAARRQFDIRLGREGSALHHVDTAQRAAEVSRIPLRAPCRGWQWRRHTAYKVAARFNRARKRAHSL
jgi:hypothetical protein